jgi:hypothetical protein
MWRSSRSRAGGMPGGAKLEKNGGSSQQGPLGSSAFFMRCEGKTRNGRPNTKSRSMESVDQKHIHVWTGETARARIFRDPQPELKLEKSCILHGGRCARPSRSLAAAGSPSSYLQLAAPIGRLGWWGWGPGQSAHPGPTGPSGSAKIATTVIIGSRAHCWVAAGPARAPSVPMFLADRSGAKREKPSQMPGQGLVWGMGGQPWKG